MANHEAIYRGTKAMQLREKRQIVVFGVGAIGSNLVDHLARMGFGQIAVFDNDRVEKHNVHNQVYTKKQVGQLKVDALKAHVYNAVGVTIETDSRLVSAENIGRIAKKYPVDTIFVDAFDNEKSRMVLKENLKDCLHVGLSDSYLECAWQDRYLVPQRPPGVDVCEYPQARSIVVMSFMMAGEAICRFIEHGVRESNCFTLKDYKVSRY